MNAVGMNDETARLGAFAVNSEGDVVLEWTVRYLTELPDLSDKHFAVPIPFKRTSHPRRFHCVTPRMRGPPVSSPENKTTVKSNRSG